MSEILKPIFVLCLVITMSMRTFAQEEENYFFKSPYSGKYYAAPYDIRGDYFDGLESGRFYIQSLIDAQLIVKKDLTSLVVAVELGDIAEERLDQVYNTLTRVLAHCDRQ